MVAPIRLRSEQVLRDAHRARRQHHDEILLGSKALMAAQKAFDLQVSELRQKVAALEGRVDAKRRPSICRRC
jgi:hypothetical protein